VSVPLLVGEVAGLAPETPAADAHDHDAHDHDHDHDHDAQPGPKYIPTSAGVCGPGAGGKKPRVWAATTAYAVGEYHVGVRANSRATDELLRNVFKAHALPDGTEAPENYSVILNDEGTKASKSINMVLSGNTTVVRTRSPRRTILGLANYLSALIDEDEDGGDVMNVAAVGAVIGQSGVLLPATIVSWLDRSCRD
jgi:hypothetical protein